MAWNATVGYEKQTATLYTDASIYRHPITIASVAYVVKTRLGLNAGQRIIPDEERASSFSELAEFYAIYWGLLQITLLDLYFDGKCVDVFCDNLTVVKSLNNQKTPKQLNENGVLVWHSILRRVHNHLSRHQLRTRFFYIKGHSVGMGAHHIFNGMAHKAAKKFCRAELDKILQ